MLKFTFGPLCTLVSRQFFAVLSHLLFSFALTLPLFDLNKRKYFISGVIYKMGSFIIRLICALFFPVTGLEMFFLLTQ
jgi:hypothetical protein